MEHFVIINFMRWKSVTDTTKFAIVESSNANEQLRIVLLFLLQSCNLITVWILVQTHHAFPRAPVVRDMVTYLVPARWDMAVQAIGADVQLSRGLNTLGMWTMHFYRFAFCFVQGHLHF